jgi:hypothetical protein
MTDSIYIGKINFVPDLSALQVRLRIRRGSALEEDFNCLLDEVRLIARPKAFYKLAFIDKNERDELVIDGIHFHSQLLCTNLAEVHRAFAYIATCGIELERRREKEEDMVQQFWLDAIMESALRNAIEAIHADIEQRFKPGKVAVMNPGSLPDWPITQQKPFFDLLGEEAMPTGVQLTDSMLMKPAKSVTGLLFETDSGFVNCQLCSREKCPNRRAGYDAHRIYNQVG